MTTWGTEGHSNRRKRLIVVLVAGDDDITGGEEVEANDSLGIATGIRGRGEPCWSASATGITCLQ